jgi:hypothetical protein
MATRFDVSIPPLLTAVGRVPTEWVAGRGVRAHAEKGWG